jgi:hypothetical protein
MTPAPLRSRGSLAVVAALSLLGESQIKPISSLGLDYELVEPRKAVAIDVMSAELADFSSPPAVACSIAIAAEDFPHFGLRRRFSMKPRSPSSPFIHASMNSHGAVRSKRYHAASMFKYMSDIIVCPVNRSTIGYFKSVTVDAPSRRATDRAASKR